MGHEEDESANSGTRRDSQYAKGDDKVEYKSQLSSNNTRLMFKVGGLKVAPAVAPPTFNDTNFKVQAPGVNNKQNDPEQRVDNVFRFYVGIMVVEQEYHHSSQGTTPQKLFVHWQEYELGIDCRQPIYKG